jgi:hypothetical protein
MQRWYVSGPETQTNGGTYYRQILPFRHCLPLLQEREVEVILGGKLSEDYDAYFFNRCLNLVYLPIVIELKRKDRLIVWDIDDDYKSLPQRVRANGEMAALELNGLNICLGLADIITTINPALTESIDRPEKTLTCPNLIDLDEHYPILPTTKWKGKKRILVTGSDTHREDVALVKDLYLETKREHDWVFYGHGPEWLDEDATYVPWTRTMDYPKMLRLISPDVGLVPLRTDLFNRSKSPIKVWELGLLGAKVIASNWGPYEGHPAALVNDDEPFTREDLERPDNSDACAAVAMANSWQLGEGKADWESLFRLVADAAESGRPAGEMSIR